MAALFGRHSFSRINDIDAEIPMPWFDSHEHAQLQPVMLDGRYVEIFRALISISSLLEYTLVQVTHRSFFPGWSFLDTVAEKLDNAQADNRARLASIEKMLDEWRQ